MSWEAKWKSIADGLSWHLDQDGLSEKEKSLDHYWLLSVTDSVTGELQLKGKIKAVSFNSLDVEFYTISAFQDEVKPVDGWFSVTCNPNPL